MNDKIVLENVSEADEQLAQKVEQLLEVTGEQEVTVLILDSDNGCN